MMHFARLLAVVGGALLWLAASAAVSAVELYLDDDVPKDDILAQGEHDVDPGLYPPINDDNQNWRKDLYMMRLLKTKVQGEESDVDESPDYAESSWSDALGVRSSAEKRGESSLSTSASTRASTTAQDKAQLQRKWKLKKGRGYPTLCYFKLCTFRRYYS